MYGIVIIFLVLAVIVPAVGAFLNAPTVKGARGERRVIRQISKLTEEDGYRSLHDLTLPTAVGTTQIDHVVISEFGIFVIETKNMDGWIFGDEKQSHWTQTIFRKRTRFQNPLRQNHKHIKTIQEVTGIKDEVIHNLVAFVGSADPKTEFPQNVLWSARSILTYIKSFDTPVIAASEVAECVTKLTMARHAQGRATNKAHVEHLRQQRAGRGPDGMKCPRCGSDMIERTARKTGEKFLGCSSFPRCRGIRQLK